MKLACLHCSQTLELTPEVLASLQGQPHFECPSCQGLIAVPAQPQRPMPRRPQPQARAAAGQAQHGMNRNLLVLGVVALLVLGGIAAFLASRNGSSITNIFQNTTNNIIHNNYFTQLIANGVTTMEDLKSIEEIRPYGEGFIGISKDSLEWEQSLDLAKRTAAEVLAIEDTDAAAKPEPASWFGAAFTTCRETRLWLRQAGRPYALERAAGPRTPPETRLKVVLHWLPRHGASATTHTKGDILGVRIAQIDPATGKVTVNGADPRRPARPFSWNWGDGQSEEGWFPLSHIYPDTERDFQLTITAHYTDGSTAVAQKTISFRSP